MSTSILRVGTRRSPLARWQAEWVAGQLRARGAEVELVFITTEGDTAPGPLQQQGGVGLFTKAIQQALLENRVDLAVHSLKDLPTEPVAGLALAATPPREACGDALVSNDHAAFAALPRGARVGTGSPRRKAQLLYLRPDLEVADIRGNLDTRLRKLDEGQYQAIVLAEAGLIRLGLQARAREVFSPAQMLPAVGQGALGLEIRADDDTARRAAAPLNDPATLAAVRAERALLAALRAGCLAPLGAHGRVERERLRLACAMLTPDGRARYAAELEGDPAAPEEVGRAAAAELLRQGAGAALKRHS